MAPDRREFKSSLIKFAFGSEKDNTWKFIVKSFLPISQLATDEERQPTFQRTLLFLICSFKEKLLSDDHFSLETNCIIAMKFGGRDCTGVLAPAYLSFFTATVSFLLFLVTSVGNLLICLAVYKDPNRELRTPFHFLVVNLACADLVVGLVLEPIAVAVHLKEGLADGSTGDLYPILHMSYFISCTASVLSLAAITIDRYIAVTRPFYHRAKKNTEKVLIASLAIWITSLSVPFVYFKVGYIRYTFVFANTVVILTLVILVFSYVRIFREIRHQLQVRVRLQSGLVQVDTKLNVAEREARVTKAFLLILLSFIFCYTPSCVMIYIMNFCTTCSCYSIHWLRDMWSLLIMFSSCLNPFVYAWRLPAFRSAFGIITRLHPRDPRPNSQPTSTKQDNVVIPQIHPDVPSEEDQTGSPLPPVAREEVIELGRAEVEPKGAGNKD